MRKLSILVFLCCLCLALPVRGFAASDEAGRLRPAQSMAVTVENAAASGAGRQTNLANAQAQRTVSPIFGSRRDGWIMVSACLSIVVASGAVITGFLLRQERRSGR